MRKYEKKNIAGNHWSKNRTAEGENNLENKMKVKCFRKEWNCNSVFRQIWFHLERNVSYDPIYFTAMCNRTIIKFGLSCLRLL